jgi:REP element-mobilizing transposase RayT
MPYSDLRIGRRAVSGAIYHVTTVTLRREPLFSDLQKGRVVVRQLRTLQEEGRADTLCFVVMPDHLHWLMVLRRSDLSDTVRRLKGRSARLIGHSVWQPNFHDHALRKDEDARTVARYIVANPLRAGLVARLENYPLWDAVWL